MKRNLFLIPALIFLFSCASDSKFPDFDKTENGLYYKVINKSDGGRHAVQDDILTLELEYGTDDTILYDSKMMAFPTQLKLTAPQYHGDVMEGFKMMKIGDEMEFKTSADSFFGVIYNISPPPYIDSAAYLKFRVKLLNTQSLEELRAEKQAESEAHWQEEQALIRQYIEENDIVSEPRESGLYFIETVPGKGKDASRGDRVKVHYIGRLLTGEKFDSSLDGDPFEFTLGAGHVIPGWDEAIGYMKAGGKAKIILPSRLAYADRPPPGGVIKPFSPLVFDVELLEVN